MKVLDASEGKLRAHWNALALNLKGLESQGLPVTELIPTFAAQLASVTFRSKSLRLVGRQRGTGLVVPMGRKSPRGFPFWVSFLEEWEVLTATSFRFRSSNLTFFQEVASQRFIQLFRAEWPGVRDWGTGSIGFQAPGAAHPHWQFDALSEFVSYETRRAEVERLAHALGGAAQIEEFGDDDVAALQDLTFQDAVDIDWTRMHYACQARWSQAPWLGPSSNSDAHAAGPLKLASIRNWVISALAYSMNELG